ncbi:uncharacterized protein LOC115676597 [Syzygium oleosum]|uniref:uncharacterized protein LOC115676597 n=1 Tax=Syzygium oleosum TaxID=219896 RepID=UPI0011D18CDA|nr:uncharacterized protein LOC115676597 [Syzygium oleosum]
MPFKRHVEVGKVAHINYGKEYGKLFVIVDVIDQNREKISQNHEYELDYSNKNRDRLVRGRLWWTRDRIQGRFRSYSGQVWVDRDIRQQILVINNTKALIFHE